MPDWMLGVIRAARECGTWGLKLEQVAGARYSPIPGKHVFPTHTSELLPK